MCMSLMPYSRCSHLRLNALVIPHLNLGQLVGCDWGIHLQRESQCFACMALATVPRGLGWVARAALKSDNHVQFKQNPWLHDAPCILQRCKPLALPLQLRVHGHSAAAHSAVRSSGGKPRGRQLDPESKQIAAA